jgi:hypothetical protein
MLEQSTNTINFTFPMPCNKKKSHHLTTLWQTKFSAQVGVTINKIPSFGTFELTRATIIPNNVQIWKTTNVVQMHVDK